jgi:hypothetical protein
MEKDEVSAEPGRDETEGGLFQSQEDVRRRGVQPAEQTLPPGAQTEQRYKCKYCASEGRDIGFPTSMELARHVSKDHKDLIRKRKEGEQRESVEKEIEQTEEHIWADIRLRGPEALAEILERRLGEQLQTPGVDPASRVAAIKEWDNDPTIHFDFRQLARMLISDAGVKPEKASRIVEKVEMLYIKYAPALMQGGFQPPYMPSGFQPSVAQGYQYSIPPYPYPPAAQPPYMVQPPQYPQPQQSYYQGSWQMGVPGYPPPPGVASPYYQAPPKPLTQEDVKKTVDEAIERVAEKLRPAQTSEPMVEMEMPMAYDETTGKQITQKVKAPASMLPWMMMMSNRGSVRPPEMGPKADELMDKIRDTVVGPMETRLAKAEEDVEKARQESNQARIAEADRRATEARTELNQTKDYIKDLEKKVDEERRHQNIEGYRSDSFKLVGQGFNEVAQMVKERRPFKEFMDVVFPKQPPGTPPPATTAEGASEVPDDLTVPKDA